MTLTATLAARGLTHQRAHHHAHEVLDVGGHVVVTGTAHQVWRWLHHADLDFARIAAGLSWPELAHEVGASIAWERYDDPLVTDEVVDAYRRWAASSGYDVGPRRTA